MQRRWWALPLLRVSKMCAWRSNKLCTHFMQYCKKWRGCVCKNHMSEGVELNHRCTKLPTITKNIYVPVRHVLMRRAVKTSWTTCGWCWGSAEVLGPEAWGVCDEGLHDGGYQYNNLIHDTNNFYLTNNKWVFHKKWSPVYESCWPIVSCDRNLGRQIWKRPDKLTNKVILFI